MIDVQLCHRRMGKGMKMRDWIDSALGKKAGALLG